MLMYPTSEWFEYDKIRPIHKSVFRVKVAQRCHLTCLDFHECPRHHYVTKKGLIEVDLVLGNALADMYGKCGLIREAHGVFDKLRARDVVTWTSLITGYAQIGDNETVFHLFERMRRECEPPNLMTFVGVLTACSHCGLVDKGEGYFEAISYPSTEHYSCLLDILGRAGQLDKAVAVINKMPFHPTLMVWHAVFGACKKWGNLELARDVFEFVMQLDGKDAASFVSMSNIYACADMPEDVNSY